MSASAQQSRSIVLKNTENHSSATTHARPMPAGVVVSPSMAAAKTTTGPGGKRWYSYADDVLATNSTIPEITTFRGFQIWQDTTAYFGYTPSGGSPTYSNSLFQSVGLGFDPTVAAYNDLSLEGNGLIKVTPTDAYTIDSVGVFGSYERSSIASKTGVVDTLVLSAVYGNGSNTSNMPRFSFSGMSDYGVDTLYFLEILHDTAKNIIRKVPAATAPVVTVKVPLTATDSAITFARAIPITLNVPAGNYAAAAVSFKTGDPAWTYFDTVQYADDSYKFHSFSMNYTIAGSATTPSFPPYNPNDHTSGYWKRSSYRDTANGWVGFYQPNWGWTGAGGAATTLQYPSLWFHVACAACDTIKNTVGLPTVAKNLTTVSAYPNPATDEVTIAFALVNKADVTITLTNIMGQVIATQQSKAIANGKATINTASLPNGVYLYAVEANGEKKTGRVSVTH